MRAAVCSNTCIRSLDPMRSSPALIILLIIRIVNSEGIRSTDPSNDGSQAGTASTATGKTFNCANPINVLKGRHMTAQGKAIPRASPWVTILQIFFSAARLEWSQCLCRAAEKSPPCAFAPPFLAPVQTLQSSICNLHLNGPRR